MPKLLIREGMYYSQRDEAAFFGWLQAIAGVVRVVGTHAGLEVTLRSKRLSEATLRDLIAIHFRYDLPMQELAQLKLRKIHLGFARRKPIGLQRCFPNEFAL